MSNVVKFATSKLDEYLASSSRKGLTVRVLMRPFHAGVSALHAVLEVDGRPVRIHFSVSERGWRKVSNS